MRTHFIEASHGGTGNWGKFMVGEFEIEEWARRSELPEASTTRLLLGRGWRPQTHLLVVDLQTGEGAMFARRGLAAADLAKHAIWVCPMFEPFLEWLYAYFKGQFQSIEAGLEDIQALPALVALDCPEKSALSGYRRPGPER